VIQWYEVDRHASTTKLTPYRADTCGLERGGLPHAFCVFHWWASSLDAFSSYHSCTWLPSYAGSAAYKRCTRGAGARVLSYCWLIQG